MNELVLVSTVVAPSFGTQNIIVLSLSKEQFLQMLPRATKNYCNHPLTIAALESGGGKLPPKATGFWDGTGRAIAARPKGGVRAAGANGDTQVAIDDLEFCTFIVEEAE